ncbi:4445_t:CDS:2 [Funneliformis caledonium]|uniref:4445_t:CDS:1 n=1 Tax=Funneliformis caledonium TaxID=1117310 RepID=A0A9N9AV34_9GLOM|nr:4445_t:CDS:2 [Funneliformis caledonium]
MSQSNDILEAVSQASECTTNYIAYARESTIEPEVTKLYLDNLNSIKEAVKPYLPLFTNVNSIIQDIVNAYENAQINKKICLTLINRAESVSLIVKQLERRKSENLENFRNKMFYQSFLRLFNILKRMDKFIQDVTLLSNIRKLTEVYSIKKQFREIIEDFDNVIEELDCLHVIFNTDEQRQEDLKVFRLEFNNVMKFFETINSGVATIITQNNHINYQVNTTILELILLKCKVQKQNTNFDDKWKPKLMTSDELQDPPSDDNDKQPTGTVKYLKKIFRREKKVSLIPADSIPYVTVDYQKHVIIDYIKMKLGNECKHIHQFYGMAKLNQNFYAVYEWTELGKLSEVYEKYELDWSTKLRIASDILSGLIFLNCCDIIHKSIRCDNILMTENMKPKITNINLFINKNTSSNNSNAYANWLKDVYYLAPEIIDIQSYSRRYTTKSQIFSIGMLLWELAFQRIPYKDWQIATVQNHVLSGKREEINLGVDQSIIQQGFINLIEAAWQQDPDDRPDIITFFDMLYALYSNYYMGENNSLQKRPSSMIRDKEKAWKCFEANAQLGNISAIYWQGYYLWEGYYTSADHVRAINCYKEAAKNGHADAQLRYAFSAINREKMNLKGFLKFLKMSANEGNALALFNLGDVYLHGKFGVVKDEELGIKYLKVAAVLKQPKAIEILKSLNVTDTFYL